MVLEMFSILMVLEMFMRDNSLRGQLLKFRISEYKVQPLKSHWPNISANDSDPGSGSKNLSLNLDHF